MLLAQSALIFPVLLLPCDAPAGGAAGGGVSVAGGAAGGGVSVAGGGASAVSPSPAGGGASVVSPSPAGGGGNVGQLPLASGVEPSGHDCAYEDCSIDNDDDCTVRIAAVTSNAITIVIEDVLFMVFFTMNIKEIGRFYPLCERRYRK
jgi:hypothetical protein